MTGWSAVTWDTARAGGLISYLLLTTAVSLVLYAFHQAKVPQPLDRSAHLGGRDNQLLSQIGLIQSSGGGVGVRRSCQ